MYRVTSPLSVPVSKKKKFILNLNVYRNTNRFALGNAKIKYTEVMKDQISTLPILERLELVYVLFPKTRRLTDISNVTCIHDKFFCDALIKYGRLPDDDYRYIKDVHYRMGKVDPNNPRVDVYLLDPNIEGIQDIMKVSQLVELTAEDVKIALEAFLSDNGVAIDLDTAEVTLRVNGTATIELDSESEAPEPEKKDNAVADSKPVKKRVRRTKAQIEADKKAEEEATSKEIDEASDSTEEKTSDADDELDLFDDSPNNDEMTLPASDGPEEDDDSLFG